MDLTLPPRLRRCTRSPRNEIETELEDDMMESLINGAVETHNRDGTEIYAHLNFPVARTGLISFQ